MNIGILEPDSFSNDAIKVLESIGRVHLYAGDGLDAFVNDKDAIFVRLKYMIDESVLSRAPRLRYICSPTTGLNHIDLKLAATRSVNVISLKGEDDFLKEIRATPEHAFGLTLALIRNYKCAILNASNSAWDRDLYRGYELFKNSVGIVGMGRVGTILAGYFMAFGCKVTCFDNEERTNLPEGVTVSRSIEDLILESEIVLLAVSYSEENQEFFGRRYFEMLKDKYFVNIARGELLDEDCLLQLLVDGHFAGVGLDVVSGECAPENNLPRFLALVESQNLIVTPHIAGATYTSMARTEEFIAQKLVCVAGARG